MHIRFNICPIPFCSTTQRLESSFYLLHIQDQSPAFGAAFTHSPKNGLTDATQPFRFQTEAYLATKYPEHTSDDNLFINGALCPDEHLTGIVKGLPHGNALVSGTGEILAVRTHAAWKASDGTKGLSVVEYTEPFTMIRNVWDIFGQNGAQIKTDYERIASVRKIGRYYRLVHA